MARKKQDRVVETAFNRYELLQAVGQGGTGRVWRAIDSTGSSVAIKILAAERATIERRKRFKNEILFCQRAGHPNIVTIHDYGVAPLSDGVAPFYVMPLLEASSRSHLAATGDVVKNLSYFDQVLSGVDAAHRQGVVHRDLKPENILYDPTRDALVVADFGIAHFADEELYTMVETAPNARLANFQYAAPEQRVRGCEPDVRVDIYSLGLMLNEMFTGEVPYGVNFKTVASVLPEFAWIDDIVAEMIQQDPVKRFASVDAVKCAFVSKRHDFVTRQRLSEIKNVVVPVGEEDDPLALDPPRVVDFDWQDGRLTLILSSAVNPEWVQALQNMGSHTAAFGKGPERFSFNGNKAFISADDSDVQRIIDFFKQWLPRATEIYRNTRQQRRQRAAEREREKLRLEQEELERRRRLRETVRL